MCGDVYNAPLLLLTALSVCSSTASVACLVFERLQQREAEAEEHSRARKASTNQLPADSKPTALLSRSASEAA